MNRNTLRNYCSVLLTLGIAAGSALAASAQEADVPDPRNVEILGDLDAGHWVEVRGSLLESGTFVAERIELTRPRREDFLWGPAKAGATAGRITVLGRDIETGPTTRWAGGTLETCIGQRVRVRGLENKHGGIVAHSIEVRNPGVARIAGRIENAEQLSDGTLHVEVLGFPVLIPPDVKQRSAIPLSSLQLAAAARPSSVAADMGDFFGEGFMISKTVRVGVQQEIAVGSRRNMELDDPDDTDIDELDDRDDTGSRLRARAVWAPTPRVTSLVDLRHRILRRDLGGGLHETSDEVSVGEAYVLFRDVGLGFDIQLGRQDFDDSREWLYDQNLDALRLFRDAGPLHLEMSVSTTLSDGSLRDEDALNTIVYVSNRNRRRHMAAYLVHRDFGSTRDEASSHIGVRAIGRWSDQIRGWVELSSLTGNRGPRDVAAWGGDMGLSWTSSSPSRLTLSLGLAHGSGDSGGTRDSLFRQTGLQDNNARLGGVTAVRYYGELMAPELSNMIISTVGIGRRFMKTSSIELIGHTYHQDVASTSLPRTSIDQNPDGVSKDLGTELNIVIGIRRFERLDFEIVGARFEPGSAFPIGEPATLARVQVRYRY